MNKTNMQDSELERAMRQQFHERYGDPPPVAPLWSQLSARLAVAREPARATQPAYWPARSASPFRSGRRLSLRQSIALGLFLVVTIGAASYSASVLLHPLLQVPVAAGTGVYAR